MVFLVDYFMLALKTCDSKEIRKVKKELGIDVTQSVEKKNWKETVEVNIILLIKQQC